MGCGASQETKVKRISTKLETKKTVVIVGGGYAGIKLARALDTQVNVILIDRKDHFFHAVGSLRAAVDPETWSQRICIPYDRLLQFGAFEQGVVTEIGEDNLSLDNGKSLKFDAVVTCTGFTGGFWKPDMDAAAQANNHFGQVKTAIESSKDLLIIGGGPVGVEFAGEIFAKYPSKRISLVTSGSQLMAGFPASLHEKLAKQLSAKGVSMYFNQRVDIPNLKVGINMNSEQVILQGEVVLTPDLICLATGPKVVLPAQHPFEVNSRGQIIVDHTFKCGPKHFAIGDCATTGDDMNAFHASMQAQHLAKSLVMFCEQGKEAQLPAYKGGPKGVTIVPLGPQGGASSLPFGTVGPALTAAIKSKGLFTDQTWKDLGFKNGMKDADKDLGRLSSIIGETPGSPTKSPVFARSMVSVHNLQKSEMQAGDLALEEEDF